MAPSTLRRGSGPWSRPKKSATRLRSRSAEKGAFGVALRRRELRDPCSFLCSSNLVNACSSVSFFRVVSFSMILARCLSASSRVP